TVAPGISIGAPSVALTSGGPVSYEVTYAGASSITLASDDVSLVPTGSASASVAISGSGSASRTVTLSNITGDGNLSIVLAAGTASDGAGNLAGVAGPSASVTVDNTGPGVSIGEPSVQDTR